MPAHVLNQTILSPVNGATTEFVYNTGGQIASEWNASTHAELKGHYYWGAKPVAYYTTAADGGAATHFEHQDWLGTERARTAYNGSVEGEYASLPWGDGQATSGADTDANHFAMLDFDSQSDTGHAQYRQYSPTEGRWLRPDPYAGSYDSSNPQSMNRYTYAMNSPVSDIDPSGQDCIYDEGGGMVGIVYGDCGSGTDSGYYIDCDGCIYNNATSGTLDIPTGTLTFYDQSGAAITDSNGNIAAISGFADPQGVTTDIVINGNNQIVQGGGYGAAGFLNDPLPDPTLNIPYRPLSVSNPYAPPQLPKLKGKDKWLCGFGSMTNEMMGAASGGPSDSSNLAPGQGGASPVQYNYVTKRGKVATATTGYNEAGDTQLSGALTIGDYLLNAFACMIN